MNPEDVRLECLRLACVIGGQPDEVVSRARLYADFLLGSSDVTPAETTIPHEGTVS